MRKLLYYVLAAAIFCSCGDKDIDPVQPEPDKPNTEKPEEKPEETLASNITGEWHCTVSDIEAEIYLALTSDKTFELYQKVGEGAFRLYKGAWTLDEDTAMLTGKYNDGNPWGSGYAVTLSEDRNSMTLTPSEGSEKQTYSRKVIPSEVKEGCVVVVKSGSEDPLL